MSTLDHEELEHEFPEVVDILLTGLPAAPTEPPGEHVWAAIAAELAPYVAGVSGSARVAGPGGYDGYDGFDAYGGHDGLGDHHGSDGFGGSDGFDGYDGAWPPPNHGAAFDATGRSRAWGWPLALVTGAVAVLLVVVPLVLASLGGEVDGDRRAELAAISGWTGSGRAVLVGRELTVSLRGDTAPTGSHFELWLVDLDDAGLAGARLLGPIGIDEDRSFLVPADVDLSRFDSVDVSLEADDGDPAHGGFSLLRGELTGS